MASLPQGFLPVPLFPLPVSGHFPLLTSVTGPPPIIGSPTLPLVNFTPAPLNPFTFPIPTPAVSELKTAEQELERNDITELVKELTDPYVRDFYIVELLEKRGNSSELAPLLWYSMGSMSCLIDDIVSGYIYIDPPKLNSQQSRKLCNTLKLLQCVAQHPETQPLFINAQIHMLLYPYLNTLAKEEPIESLRQSTLSVILALVKNSDNYVVGFLFTTTTEILPLCFRIVKTDIYQDLSTKLLAIAILRKVLLTDFGLFHICHNPFFLSDITAGLCKIIKHLSTTKQITTNTRLLKYIIHCLFRLSEDITSRDLLRRSIPPQLRDSTCYNCFKDDTLTKQWVALLWKNLGTEHASTTSTRRGKGSKKKENGKKENCKTSK